MAKKKTAFVFDIFPRRLGQVIAALQKLGYDDIRTEPWDSEEEFLHRLAGVKNREILVVTAGFIRLADTSPDVAGYRIIEAAGKQHLPAVIHSDHENSMQPEKVAKANPKAQMYKQPELGEFDEAVFAERIRAAIEAERVTAVSPEILKGKKLKKRER